MVVILSDIDGYYDKNLNEHDNAVMYKLVTYIPRAALEKPDSPTHKFTTGGIVTKLKAAQFMLDKGRKIFLCNGYDLTSPKEFLIDHQHSKGTLLSRSYD